MGGQIDRIQNETQARIENGKYNTQRDDSWEKGRVKESENETCKTGKHYR